MIDTQYKAFISYRHQSPDQDIAVRLHRQIERYTVPSALRKDGAKHPGRVFRDQDELPLSPDLGEDIEAALDHSEWLICVCSPRYLESRWCLREVEYFLKHHDRNRVLPILAEGEPKDAFPDLLLYETTEDGKRTEHEPLAADVRAESVSGSMKKLRKEKLRILAPMLGTTFDGLYQRQRRRALRNVLAGALAAVAVLGGFLAYALVQNGKITRQNEQITAQNEQISRQNTELTEKNEKIEAQNTELTEKNEQIEAQNTELTEKNEKIEAQNTELTEKNEQITAQNKQISEQNVRIEEERTTAARNECDLLTEKSVYYSSINRKQEATRLALEALDVSATIDGYADEQIKEALAVSCFMGDFAVESELDFPGFVNYDPQCIFSPDGTRIAVVDSRSGLTLCDAATGARLWVSTPFSHDITSVRWKEDGTRLAVTAKWGHTVCLIDAATGEHLKEFHIPWAHNAVFDGDGLIIAFERGLIRWQPDVSDENFPYVMEKEPDQHSTSRTLLDGRFITWCDLNPAGQKIYFRNNTDGKIYVMEPGGTSLITGYTLSPDGKWMYAHQYDRGLVMNLETDEVRWEIQMEKGTYDGLDGCSPIWTGDVILDCGYAYNALTGEVLYTTGNETVAAVSPDGEYFASATAIYRVRDGSWYADVPGTLRGISPAGDRAVVYQGVEYSRGVPGNPDAVMARRQKAYVELYPGNGSQYTVEKYEGTLLDVPDWTDPKVEEGTILGFNDPYGSNTMGYIQSKGLFSPDGRFYLVTNLGAYIPFYDLEKGNEPIARVYDFSVGDHVEAIDASFSPDSRLVAVAGAAGHIAVYELETGSMVRSFTDTYLAHSLSEVKFNRSGNYLMAADFRRSSFRVYSVTNGQTLYIIHAVKEVESWGFDEKTGDAVLVYTDGSALIHRMFEDREELLSYARSISESSSR